MVKVIVTPRSTTGSNNKYTTTTNTSICPSSSSGWVLLLRRLLNRISIVSIFHILFLTYTISMLLSIHDNRKTYQQANTIPITNSNNNKNNHNNHNNNKVGDEIISTPALKNQNHQQQQQQQQQVVVSSIYQDAYYESYGYFNDITNTSWDMKRQRSRYFPIWYSRDWLTHRLDHYWLSIFHIENLYPSFTCPHAKRIGGLGIGPKWICDPHRLVQYNDCLIYSIGLGYDTNYKFEDGINDELLLSGDPTAEPNKQQQNHCEIHIFDPDPDHARTMDARGNGTIQYHTWGIGSTSPLPGNTYKTFQQTVRELNHTGRRLDILKIDCNDGCEWDNYHDWLFINETVFDIRQLVISTHAAELEDVHSIVQFFDDILLQRGYVLYSREVTTIPGRIPLGSYIEYSFLKLRPSFGPSGQYDNTHGKRLLTLNTLASKNNNYNPQQHQQAYDDSYGYFDDITNKDWAMQRRYVQRTPNFRNTTNPDYQRYENPALWHMNNVYPTFACPNLYRVGGILDGPKWICDPERLIKYDDCLIYSFGSNGIYLFEDAINTMVGTKHCEIHVFDPDPKFAHTNDTETKNIHYHALGMGSSYSNTTIQFGGFTFKSFPEIIHDLGHVGRRIDIFKIDCEGCEWTSYQDWLTDIVDIRQISIETHTRTAPDTVNVGQFFTDIFNKGFVLYSKEANEGPTPPYVQGTYFEWSFIRLKPSFSGVDGTKVVVQPPDNNKQRTSTTTDLSIASNEFPLLDFKQRPIDTSIAKKKDTVLYNNNTYGNLYNEAYEESFGYLDDITNNEWDFKRERYRSIPVWSSEWDISRRLVNYQFGKFFMENLQPSLTCKDPIRVGGLGDGPKWICDPHRLAKYSDCLIYSVGSGGNYKLEDGLLQLLGPNQQNCEIHIFDPDPRYARSKDSQTKNIQYHAWGIGSPPSRSRTLLSSSSSFVFKTFRQTLNKLNHKGRRIDLLKLDCDGCEWTGYHDWLSSGLADIRQLSIATHAAKAKDVSVFKFFDDIINQGYVLYSKEVNTMPNQIPIGSFYEFSFIKLSKTFGTYGHGNTERLQLLTQKAATNENYIKDKNKYQVAFDASFGYFDDISDTEWERKRKHAQINPTFTNITNPDDKRFKNPVWWYMNNVYPNFACPNLFRVGGLEAGSKWICDPERLVKYNDCLIYSFTVNPDRALEHNIDYLVGAGRCEIHIFHPDPTFAQGAIFGRKNIHFHPIGIRSSYDKPMTDGGLTFQPFPDIVQEMGHTGRRIDIVQIDCNGCEWTSYKDWLRDSAAVDIRQMIIRTHGIKAGANVNVGQFFLDIFNKGFVLYSKEAYEPVTAPYLRGLEFDWSFLKLEPGFIGSNVITVSQ